MSWQKFSDRARESRKVRRSPLDAIGFWWAAGNWCCEHKTDGFIPKEDLPDIFRPIGHQVDHAAMAAECVKRKLFIDHGEAYEVHDWLEFNHSKERDDERKAKDARRAAEYRARQKKLRELGIAKESVEPSRVTSRERHGANVTGSDVTHAASADERHADDDTKTPSDVRHALPSRPASSRPASFSDQTPPTPQGVGEGLDAGPGDVPGEADERPSPAQTGRFTRQPAADIEVMRVAFHGAAEALGWLPAPDVSKTDMWAAARRAAQAVTRDVTYHSAAYAIAKAAMKRARLQDTPGMVGHLMKSVEPFRPPALRARNGRMERAEGTTGADFEGVDTEAQLAEMARMGGGA